MSEVPVFAVVGAPSEGKTTLIATLAEDAGANISPHPHTTRRCKEYKVILDGTVVMRFIDTPGLKYPMEFVNQMEAKRGDRMPHRSAIESMYNLAVQNGGFEYEVEALTPLLTQDAAAIVVVDASRGYDETLEPVMQILSWTCQPRAVVVNYHAGDERMAEQMCQIAHRWAGIVRKIDAARASWKARFNLLHDLVMLCKQDHRDLPEVQKVLAALQQRWESRCTHAALRIAEMLNDCMCLRISESRAADCDCEKGRNEVKDRFERDVRQKEKECHENIIEQFKQNRALLSWGAGLALADVFSEESQRVFGLTRWQLAVGAAGTSVAAGVTVDMVTGGALIGIPTAIGALTAVPAALAGYCGHRHVPVRVSIPAPRPIKRLQRLLKLDALGVRTMEFCVGPVDPSFSIILLRRAMFVLQNAVHIPHGHRSDTYKGRVGEIEIENLDREACEKEVVQLCASLQRGRDKTGNVRRKLEEIVEKLCHSLVE